MKLTDDLPKWIAWPLRLALYAFVLFVLFSIALGFVNSKVMSNAAECNDVISGAEPGLKHAKAMVTCLRKKNGLLENWLSDSVFRAVEALPYSPAEFVGTWDASQPGCNYRHKFEANGEFVSEARGCPGKFILYSPYHGVWGMYDNQLMLFPDEGVIWPPVINTVDVVDKDLFLLVEQDGSRTKFSRIMDAPSTTPVADMPFSPTNTGTGSLSASSTATASDVAPAQNIKEPSQPDIADTPLHQTHSETFMAGETVYVTAPRAAVDMNGTAISLPIGTSVKVNGAAESCSFESESDNVAICVFIGEIYGDEIDPGFPDGLASENRFGHKQPTLTTLLAEYDKTPKDSKDIRRELAEKAITLDPWSNDAQKRVLEALNEAGDQQAIAVAEETFRRYQEHRPQISTEELPTIFHYDGQQIRPFAANVKGVIKEAGPKVAGQRGTFFHMYGDHMEGFAVTTQTFSCEPKCPIRIPVQNIGLDGKLTVSKLNGIYATNFIWTERNKPLPSVTSTQKAMLISMLKEKIESYSGAAASAAKEKLKSGKIEIVSGQLSDDGRIFLVGSLLIGSASDEHYNDMPYVSEFIILEQQKDGGFIKASTNVSNFSAEYCSISGILRDMNGDGTDEIITYCNSGVEGPYADNLNGILQRSNNQWVKAF